MYTAVAQQEQIERNQKTIKELSVIMSKSDTILRKFDKDSTETRSIHESIRKLEQISRLKIEIELIDIRQRSGEIVDPTKIVVYLGRKFELIKLEQKCEESISPREREAAEELKEDVITEIEENSKHRIKARAIKDDCTLKRLEGDCEILYYLSRGLAKFLEDPLLRDMESSTKLSEVKRVKGDIQDLQQERHQFLVSRGLYDPGFKCRENGDLLCEHTILHRNDVKAMAHKECFKKIEGDIDELLYSPSMLLGRLSSATEALRKHSATEKLPMSRLYLLVEGAKEKVKAEEAEVEGAKEKVKAEEAEVEGLSNNM